MLTEKARGLVRAFGYLYPEEAEFLQRLSLDVMQGGVVVNIGAGAGTSALCVLEKRPDLTKTFYSVDINNHDTPLGGLLNERNAFDNAKMPYPQQVHGDSHEVAKTWSDGDIDFLIIDGDHSREGVRGDITLWEQHLAEGAMVLLHDYHSGNWAEVYTAVQELMSEHPEKYTHLETVKTYIAFVYTKK